jgi:hypothetical protein
MKKLGLLLASLFLTCNLALAVETPARNISVEVSTFVNCLTSAATNAQSAIDALDVCFGSVTPSWGHITGTLSNQTDLQNALNAKQNTITTGTTAQYFRGDLSLATFPTNLNQFTNGPGYISSYTETDPIFSAWLLATPPLYPSAIGSTVQGYNSNTLINPMTALGDIIVENSTPAPAKLSGNITTTKKFLRQTGNGTISALPAWDTVTSTDVGLNNVTNNKQIIGLSSGTTTGHFISFGVDGYTPADSGYNGSSFDAYGASTNGNTAYGWGNWASNFGTTAGSIAQGNDSRINNGQTAYGWGNPSGVYLPIAGTAANSSELGGQLPAYYQTASSILGGISGLTYVSGSPHVIMTGASSFGLDSTTYLAASKLGTVTATDFCHGDGSGNVTCADGSTYLTAEADTLDSVTGRGNTTLHAITAGGIRSGSIGVSGQYSMYKHISAGVDWLTSLNPNAAQSANVDFYLPPALPASTYLLNMTTGGVIGYDTNTYVTGTPWTGLYLPLGGGTLTGNLTLSTHNIVTDTTTGTDIGTATTQKVGFFGATPVVQQTGNVCTALNNLGLTTSCSESGGAPAFSSITTGTNTVALHIGTGGTLDATGTGTIAATSATTATNIAGGLGGYIPYQTAVNATGLLANGNAGQILRSAGTTVAPLWSTPTFPNTATLNHLMIGDGTNWLDSAVPTWNQSTSGTATNATNVAITDSTTNATYYPTFVTAHTGNTGIETNYANFTYNPSTNTLTAGTFVGALTGTASGNLTSAAIGSTIQAYNSNLTAINQALTSTSSPSFTKVTAALSGNATTSTTAANLSGTPALPNGTTATTQSAGDNSTKLATTAYVNGTNGFTTQNVVTGSRNINTSGSPNAYVYQNTTGKTMMVTVSAYNSGGAQAQWIAYSDNASSPTTIVVQAIGLTATAQIVPMTFLVLPNNYYKVTAVNNPVTLANWTEWY